MRRRRIKKAKINFISLVDRPANRMPVIYKSEDGSVEFSTVTKYDDERGELLAVVYAAEHRDSQGDIASADVVKSMAHDAMRRGVEIDIQHDNKPVGRDKAYVAESFIVAKGDARFAGWKDNQGQDVDLTDAWATVIKLEDPPLRERAKKGEIGGVSMAGTAELEVEKADDEPPTWFQKALASIGLGTFAKAHQDQQDETMKPEDIQKIVDTAIAKVVEDVTKAVKPATPPDDPKSPPADPKSPPADPKSPPADEVIKFEGDPTDAKAVKAHLQKVQIAQLRKSVDWNDPVKVAEYLQKLEEITGVTKSDADDDADEFDADADAETRSAQPVRKGRKATPLTAGLEKSQADDVTAMLEAIGVSAKK